MQVKTVKYIKIGYACLHKHALVFFRNTHVSHFYLRQLSDEQQLMQTNSISELIKQHGLVCSSFAYNELPDSVKQKLIDAYPGNFENSFITLIANAGGVFWQAMMSPNRADAMSHEHPVDDFSISIAKKLIAVGEQTQNAEILYPGYPVPLIKLGELCGWSHPSPLGLGLHSEFGPWLAYRALIKTKEPLQPIQAVSTTPSAESSNPESPCLSCVNTPCISACPASATSIDNVFDIKRCASHRLKEASECKTQCHARNACPVGQAFRYSKEQREYHMTHALDALQKWAKLSDDL